MTQLGLMDMYGRLGMTEHDMKDDMININSVDVVNVTGLCCSPGKSPKQGPLNVKGRLKEHLSFWHKINANQWVISIIRDGYALPFVELPLRKEDGEPQISF